MMRATCSHDATYDLIKSDLGTLLRHIYIFEEGAICVVPLLLDSPAKLEQLIGDGLVGGLKDVDQTVVTWR